MEKERKKVRESERERDEGLVTWVQNPGATGCTIKCSSTRRCYVDVLKNDGYSKTYFHTRLCSAALSQV